MKIEDILSKARSEKRHLLSYTEAKRFLESAGIPAAPWEAAANRDEAVKAARAIGFPVVMKVVSPDLVHKSDVGGVVTNLKTEEEVGAAFDRMMNRFKESAPDLRMEGVTVEKLLSGLEVILGVTRDPQFGHVVMFGMGGVMVELLKDVAFRLIPLEPADAEDMIREIKGYPLLEGFRGTRGDPESLKDLLIRVSDLVTRYPEISGIDLNPVITSPSGSIVADARIAL